MTNQHDGGSAGGGDRTILRPRPGAGRAAEPGGPVLGSPPTATPPMSTPAPALRTQARVEFARGALDPLFHAAAPLLLLAGRLRQSTNPIDTGSLRRQLSDELRLFDQQARAAGIEPDQVGAASYALCAALDEAIQNTPWGADSDWGAQPLLVLFHREAWGGENFFRILEQTSGDPARYGGLLEVLYACLSLGFAGKYALDQQGALQRDRLQHDLFERIRGVRAQAPPALSEHWQGVRDRRNPFLQFVPVWVVAAALLALLTGTYLFYRASLSKRAEPVLAALSQAGVADFSTQVSATPLSEPSGKTLKMLLSNLERQGLLEVSEDGSRSTVILSGSNLFDSGSAALNSEHLSTLRDIALALNDLPGRVLVVGHTDDQPIKSFRYQNNHELSAARATAVLSELQTTLHEPNRVSATGVGSSEPRYSPPNTAENRARNRRVEIVHALVGAGQP